jgi:rhodanese-related sulfurtransferase
MILVGKLRMQVLYTPGHTEDSTCLLLPDRVLTGDTLLIGGTGRTDLPTGDPEALHESLFGKLLLLDDALLVFPAHDYKDRSSSTLGAEKAGNLRLQKKEKREFVDLMRNLNLSAPQHLTEALRTNRTGGKTVRQLIAEAASQVPFMSMEEVRMRIERRDPDLVLLDVREKDAFEAEHLPGARHLPRGQLELRVDRELPDPTARILTYCQLGKVSTLAASTLRTMGYTHVVALDGGMDAWQQAGYPIEKGPAAS